MGGPATLDLIVLAADKKIEAAVQGICRRGRSLGFSEISFKTRVHPRHDPGCLHEAHVALRPFASQFRHAIVVLDKEGSGKESPPRVQIEAEIEAKLNASGWGDRAKVIVIDPELEAWIWSDSPHVAEALGWESGDKALRDWLVERGWCQAGSVKPTRPKEAYEAALQKVSASQSASIYRRLAGKVGLTRCTDPAFMKLKTILQEWFGVG